jgi:chemotaxis protein methyltransferase CheR
MVGEPLSKSISPESPGFPAVVAELQRRLGASFVGRWLTLCGYLGERLQQLQLTTLDQYAERLRQGDASELRRVLELVTNGETYFFRQPQQLAFLTASVLPQLVQATPKTRSRVIWSAGCSSGEEVYTLAALALESGLFRDGSVRIVGSDIVAERLEKARQGYFSESSFRATNAEFSARHFSQTTRGALVGQSLRDICEFHQMNLLDESATSSVAQADIIFCRNVLIYMDDEARKLVETNLLSRLAAGGWLFLGPGERLLHVGAEFESLSARSVDAYRHLAHGGTA